MPAAPRLAALLLGPLMVIGLLLGLASPAGAQSRPVFPDQVEIGATPNEDHIDLYFQLGVATDTIVFPEATGGPNYAILRQDPEDHTLESLGFSFDPTSRVFSGTPTLAGAGPTKTRGFKSIYEATNPRSGDTINVYITVCEESGSPDGATVCTPPAFAALGFAAELDDEDGSVGTAINLVLPEATGGTGTNPRFLYTLRDLPAGLSFDAASRTLSGTPTAVVAESTITYHVQDDASGEQFSQEFKLTVAADTTPPVITFDRFEHAGGVVVGSTTFLNAGDTLTAFVSSDEPLAATSLVDAAFFDFDGSVRPAQDLQPVAGVANQYMATYTITTADDDAGPQFNVRGVTDTADPANTAADFRHSLGTVTIDTATPTITLVGGPVTVAHGGTYTEAEDAGISGAERGDTTAMTTTRPDAMTVNGIAVDTTTPGDYLITYIVTDRAGNAAALTRTVTVAAAPLALTAPDDQGYTVGTAVDVTLPEGIGGTGTLRYTLTGALPAGLGFDPDTRKLTGTPTEVTSATTLTYTVTDKNGSSLGDSASQTFTVAVNAPLALPAQANQSYTVDTEITALELPAATGGSGTLSYTLTGPAGGALPVGLSFDTAPRRLTGTPTALASTELTYTVTDTNGATATADFTVTVAALSPFADLNRTILPEVARAIAGHTVGAIARRVTQARADGVTDSAGSFNLGGQTTVAGVAGALASHGQAMADGTLSLKDLLGGGDFVLPLNARAAAGAPGLSSLAFWGAGDYSNLDGSGGAVDWDGDLFSAHLGADARLRDDLLVGLAVSWSRVDLDYSDPDRSGDYELDLTSFHPYVGWSALSGKLDLWATVGYGWGDLEIADETQQASSDVEMRTVAVGGLGRLLKVGATTLRLKGDALLTEMEVEGSDEMAALTVDARRVRMILEGSRTHTLADGAQLEPSLEVGVRHDGGDGETGFGAELGGGVRYSNPVMGLTLEGRARTLVGRDSYGEWGVNGLIRLERGNGRGLSFNLSPGYGKTGSGTQRLWQQGLHDKIDGERDYGARMDLRLGYGLPAFGGRGLLTPYSELTFGDSARNYRLGMEWELGALFELNLTGERHESSDGAADHAIMLKGEVRF